MVGPRCLLAIYRSCAAIIPGGVPTSRALPIAPTVSGNWDYKLFHFHRRYHNGRVNRKS